MVTQKNSSDLDVGRRPKHESDEFFGVTIQVEEIISLLCLKPPKQVVQLLAARPGIDVAHNNLEVNSVPDARLEPGLELRCETSYSLCIATLYSHLPLRPARRAVVGQKPE